MAKYIIHCELIKLHIHNKVNSTMLDLMTCHQVVEKVDLQKIPFVQTIRNKWKSGSH